jgi:mannose-6-phosphate isomerase-like protein (cupin superfamily)
VSGGNVRPGQWEAIVGFAHVVPPGTGATVSALGSTYVMKTDGSATQGAYSLVEEEFWGDPTPLHRHLEAEESFYVISGTVAAWLEDCEVTAPPGTFLVVPRGVTHGLRRVSASPVRMLTLVSPPGLQGFFDEVAAAGEAELLADLDRLIRLAAKYGSEIVGDYPGAGGDSA